MAESKPHREYFIRMGWIRPAARAVRFDRQIDMWAEADGPSLLAPIDAPTLRLLPGERQRFEREALNPRPATFAA